MRHDNIPFIAQMIIGAAQTAENAHPLDYNFNQASAPTPEAPAP